MTRLIVILVITALLPVFGAYGNCVDFDSLVTGTQYGDPVGNVDGDVIFTEDGIPVSVHTFEWTSGGTTFHYCEVDVPAFGLGSGNTMATNNINLKFDFTGLGSIPTQVQFEFADLGGNENISVNGEPIFHDDLINAPNPIAPGVMIASSTISIGGGIKGSVILIGPVETLLIGGQEFWIDNVCTIGPSSVNPATTATTTWGHIKNQGRR